MATFNYTVDTHPMAEEISTVSRHVNLTTGAVVAMQTAVILAESEGADHVCTNVNRGFYSLIRSQISQKMAKYQSDVDSNLMQLVQQKNALLAIRTRMQRDYNMISARYVKLFNSLNSNLKQRVFELDKPVIDFAVKENDKSANRVKYLAASIPLSQSESILLSQRILLSGVKQKGVQVLSSMKNFLKEMIEQKQITDQILIADNKPENKSIAVPVILFQSCNDDSESTTTEVVVTNKVLSSQSVSFIKSNLMHTVSKLQWVDAASGASETDKQYKNMLADSLVSKRIKDMMSRMYEANKYLTL